MNSLLQDWIDHCEGKKEFDKSHFFSLFTMDFKDTDVEKMFSFFPESANLVERFRRLRSGGNLRNRAYLVPSSEYSGTENELTESLSLHLLELQKYCKANELDELYEACATQKFAYISDKAAFDKMYESTGHESAELHEEVGDYITGKFKLDDRVRYILPEAAYGLVANYDLVYYLCEPVINIDFTFDHYFKFWKLGGAYVLSNGRVNFTNTNA